MARLVPGARYDGGTRLLHWLVVLLLLAQIPAGVAMIVPAQVGGFQALPGVEQSTIDTLYVFHKGLGAILIAVVFARVAWRLTHRHPPLPATIPELERRIARITHISLHVLMVLMVVTGYVHVIGLGFPIELLDALGVPPLIPRMEHPAVISSFVHRAAAFVLVGVIGVHVAEVLRHHFVLRDGVLGRMWPPLGRGSAQPMDPGPEELRRGGDLDA